MDDSSTTILSPGRDRIDRSLHDAHTACAAVWLIGASGPMSVVEFAPIPLGVCFLIRAVVCRRLWTEPLRSPLFILLGVWAAWQGLSLLWTPNIPHGLDEMGVMRFAWALWMIYPVLDRRRTLIAAYAIGFLLGNAAQVVHYLAPGAVWHRQPDRFSGWWEPVAGGVILCSALGLHLPAAFMGRGWSRVLGAAGAGATILGIFLTGTRGAWLAAAALTALAGAFTLARLGRKSFRAMLAVALAMLVGAAALWLIAGPSITARVQSAVSEVRRAAQAEDLSAFNTDTGARLLMNGWAVRAFADRPLFGIGAGGYREWVYANAETTGVDPRRIHDHAHSSPLHIGAVNGAVGLLIVGAIVGIALRQAREHVPDWGWGTYAAGPLWAILGIVLVSATNTLHVSAQPAAHLMILFSLCPPRRGSGA